MYLQLVEISVNKKKEIKNKVNKSNAFNSTIVIYEDRSNDELQISRCIGSIFYNPNVKNKNKMPCMCMRMPAPKQVNSGMRT